MHQTEMAKKNPNKQKTKQVTHFNAMVKALLFAWWWFCFFLCQNKEDGLGLCKLNSSLHIAIITEGVTCQQVFSFNEHWGALASFFLSHHVSALLVMPGTSCPHMSSHAVLMDNQDLIWPVVWTVLCDLCVSPKQLKDTRQFWELRMDHL